MTTRQSGMTLAELMISLTLSLLVLLASTTMLLSTSSLYRSEDDVARLQDGGRFSIELIARMVRQAQYENWDGSSGGIVNAVAFYEENGTRLSPSIIGIDNVLVDSKSPADFSKTQSGGVNGSDAILLRFFGSSRTDNAANADDTVMDCAGNGTPGPSDIDTAEEDRGTSMFYVARDTNGEPNLYCAYKGVAGWATEPLVKGVESLQVLYGLDTGVADSYPNLYVPASAITGDDMWRSVVSVKVSLLIRSGKPVKVADDNEQFNLFGSQYPGAGKEDLGTVIKVASLPSEAQGRLRKVYTTTVFLRNQIIH